jgi:hypothetical protein
MVSRRACWLIGLVFLLNAAQNYGGEKSSTPVHARSQKEIRDTLTEILSATDKGADEKGQALRRLKAYRYLADVPYKDVVLDDKYDQSCQGAAKLCQVLGRLEHRPMNPGWPERDFQLAYYGCTHTNLGWGMRDLVHAVDTWMEDSDSSNIAIMGHRRCCLNPYMQKTGFGRAEKYFAMFSLDKSRKIVPDFDFVCFPARGYMPVEFFGPHYGWNVTLNPKKYQTPAKDFAPKLYLADASGKKSGEPLRLDFKSVFSSVPNANPIPNSIIFRPEMLNLTSGTIYVVELDGIVRQGSNERVNLRYVVEFMSWR